MPYETDAMSQIPLYPLRFEPIYQYRLWGGRRLANSLLCEWRPTLELKTKMKVK